MGAWWSGPVAMFLNTDPDRIGERLAHEAGRRRFSSEPQQLRAWATQLDLFRTTLTALPQTAGWQIMFEFPIPRLGGRIDTVLISPDATLRLSPRPKVTRWTFRTFMQAAVIIRSSPL